MLGAPTRLFHFILREYEEYLMHASQSVAIMLVERHESRGMTNDVLVNKQHYEPTCLLHLPLFISGVPSL